MSWSSSWPKLPITRDGPPILVIMLNWPPSWLSSSSLTLLFSSLSSLTCSTKTITVPEDLFTISLWSSSLTPLSLPFPLLLILGTRRRGYSDGWPSVAKTPVCSPRNKSKTFTRTLTSLLPVSMLPYWRLCSSVPSMLPLFLLESSCLWLLWWSCIGSLSITCCIDALLRTSRVQTCHSKWLSWLSMFSSSTLLLISYSKWWLPGNSTWLRWFQCFWVFWTQWPRWKNWMSGYSLLETTSMKLPTTTKQNLISKQIMAELTQPHLNFVWRTSLINTHEN